ncbi:MAG: GNAT family N-acetyltransferase [Candidatus Riflebacteria bacterium]|nr:GNAT family N-acetyltransferase [Candidatus Riflebacteria bacterium]
MAKSSYSEYLLQVLQRPPEVFSGIMPLERELYASRVYLRRCRKIDAPELRELMLKNRDYLEKWIQPQPEAITLNCVTDLITEDRLLAKKGLRLDLGIFRIEDDKMLGRIALHSVDFGIQRSAGVSYWVDEEETNNGYATEALATLVSFAFEEISLHKIWLKITKPNKPSAAIAKKLSFKKDGTSRKCLFINREWQDADVFSLLDEEYDSLADSWISKNYLGA